MLGTVLDARVIKKKKRPNFLGAYISSDRRGKKGKGIIPYFGDWYVLLTKRVGWSDGDIWDPRES